MARPNSRKKRRDALNIARLKWEDVYQLPLYLDPYGGYAWSENDTMSLTFDDDLSLEFCQEVIDCINGENYVDTEGWTYKDAVDFYYKGEYKFCVRGWGHLTGTGALNLPEHEAERIQDGFIQHIAKRLKAQPLTE